LKKRFGEEFVREASRFFEMTSVVKEAMIAFNSGSVHAMHDPTEGGVAGGLNELANASGTGFRVYEGSIDVAPETEKICKLFQIDPLKLVSSGSLLVVATENSVQKIVSRLKQQRIEAAIIGEVLRNRTKRTIVKRNGSEQRLPLPLADDLWKALRSRLWLIEQQ
jgi:hydrogenase maturation factor